MAKLYPTLLRPNGLEPLQGPQSVGFSRQEHWSGLPLPSPGDLPGPGTELMSPALQADSLPLGPPGKPIVTFSSVQFSRSVMSDSLRPHESQIRKGEIAMNLTFYIMHFCNFKKPQVHV